MTGASARLPFGDRLAEAVATRESQLVLGLDPDPAQLWPGSAEAVKAAGASTTPGDGPGAGQDSGDPAELAAQAVAAHCALVIDAVADQCVAVKLQVACFERLGAPGWRALKDVTAHAREHRLLVIADAKRGDIDVTATAYAQAFFGQTETPFGAVAGLGVDAMTVNPLLGADSLGPLVSTAREQGAGLFVLVHTSNPGTADIQELDLADGTSISDTLAEMVDRIGADGLGSSGLSDIGAVVGATGPSWIPRLRKRMPHAVLLLPGVGAQGGSVDALGAAFAPGPAGGLITASRAIVRAHRLSGGDPAHAAREEAARLRDTARALAV